MKKGLMNKKTKQIITQGLVLTAIASVGTCVIANNNTVMAYAGVVDGTIGQYNSGTKEDFIKNKYLSAISNYETKIVFSADEISETGMTYKDIIKNYNDLLYEHPEIFYVGEGFSANRQDKDGTFVMYIAYIYNEDEIISKKSELEAEINSIIRKFDSYDELRKLYELHDYIAGTNEYAHDYVDYEIDFSSCTTIEDRFKEVKKHKEFYETHSIYGTLINGSSVCEGYSKALMLLLNKYGIESGIIRNDVHGWNYVKVNGQYYQVDLTGNDGQDTYTSSPYRLFNCSNNVMEKVNVGTNDIIPSGTDTTFDNVLRTNSSTGIKGNNVVRIDDKLYSLDSYKYLYSYDLDCKNKYLEYDLSTDSKFSLFMKADKNYLYYVSYNIGAGTYECRIKRFDVDNGSIEEVLNVNETLGYNSDTLNSKDVDFYIEKNTLYVDYLGTKKSFKLSELVNTTINVTDATNAVVKAETSRTQADVDIARVEVEKLPSCDEKEELQERLNKVQAEIDKAEQEAENKVQLEEATKALEKAESTLSQGDVDKAQGLISKLPNGVNKNNLQDRLDVIKQEIADKEAQENYNKLLNEAIKAVEEAEISKSKEDIARAKELVSKLIDGTDKDSLQKRLDDIIEDKPSTDGDNSNTEDKPSTGGDNTDTEDKPSTGGDNSNTEDKPSTDDDDSFNSLYDKALESVKTFEKKLTSHNYRKALKDVEVLPECDEKDELMERVKKAKKKLNRKKSKNSRDEDNDDRDEVSSITTNNPTNINSPKPYEVLMSQGNGPMSMNTYNNVNSNNGSDKLSSWGQDLNGNWYYIEGGRLATGWIKDQGKWYYLDNLGVMKTGWVKDGSDWYYLDSTGAMKTGWLKDDTTGKWFFLYSNGAMARNTTIGGYKLGADGALV